MPKGLKKWNAEAYLAVAIKYKCEITQRIFVVPTEIEYMTNDGWGVKPVDGEKCWINIECTEASVELDTKIVNNYKIINEK